MLTGKRKVIKKVRSLITFHHKVSREIIGLENVWKYLFSQVSMTGNFGQNGRSQPVAKYKYTKWSLGILEILELSKLWMNYSILKIFSVCHCLYLQISRVANAISWLVNNSSLYTFLTNHLRPLKKQFQLIRRSVPTLSISVIFIRK